jgi:hypothetical protein
MFKVTFQAQTKVNTFTVGEYTTEKGAKVAIGKHRAFMKKNKIMKEFIYTITEM